MVVRKVSKKIEKVGKLINAAVGAATEVATTIHTFEDPATTKRMILDLDLSQDGVTIDDVYRVGLCITRPGETLPDTADYDSEENRWIWMTSGLSASHFENSKSHNTRIERDMKIQRKVKNGDILSMVTYHTNTGHQAGAVTMFVDAT